MVEKNVERYMMTDDEGKFETQVALLPDGRTFTRNRYKNHVDEITGLDAYGRWSPWYFSPVNGVQEPGA